MRIALAAVALGCAFWLGSATASSDGLTGGDLERACDVLAFEANGALDYTACMDAAMNLGRTHDEYHR